MLRSKVHTRFRGSNTRWICTAKDELFEWLDAPVRRLAATDTFVGYAPQLEAAILPQIGDIANAMRELSVY